MSQLKGYGVPLDFGSNSRRLRGNLCRGDFLAGQRHRHGDRSVHIEGGHRRFFKLHDILRIAGGGFVAEVDVRLIHEVVHAIDLPQTVRTGRHPFRVRIDDGIAASAAVQKKGIQH